MSMRITTNGVFHGYRSDLANSYWKMNKSMTRVTTQRNFGAYSEDVSAASRAFQLRRSHWRAETQINNSNYVISKFETAWSAIDYIVDGTGADDNLNSIVESLRGLNGPTGSARVPLGQSVLSKADSIVRLLNTQYGDQFIFAGADGKNVPLSWETGPSGERYLAYRGVDVSTPVPMTAEEVGKHITVKFVPDPTQPQPDPTDPNAPVDPVGSWKICFDDSLGGFELTDPSAAVEYASESEALTALGQWDEANYAQAFDDYNNQFDTVYASYAHGAVDADGNPVSVRANYEKLVAMSEEATYVDVGIGMDWYKAGDVGPEGDLIPSSAYNSALNALTILGFGSKVGEDGALHSNNLVVLMEEMGNVLSNCDGNTGDWPEGWDFDRVSALTRLIDASVDNVSVQHVKLSGDATYLQTNLDQLTSQRDFLNEQILDIEQINPADAISEFMYARYAYNAALSVGSSILTNTLLDYLR